MNFSKEDEIKGRLYKLLYNIKEFRESLDKSIYNIKNDKEEIQEIFRIPLNLEIIEVLEELLPSIEKKALEAEDEINNVIHKIEQYNEVI